MTLEEAIAHCIEVAETCDNDECKLDHDQLAGWLMELKLRREQELSKGCQGGSCEIDFSQFDKKETE